MASSGKNKDEPHNIITPMCYSIDTNLPKTCNVSECEFRAFVGTSSFAFAEHIPYTIYPRKLQLNKANTSDKETTFLDLHIKLIGNDIHTSVYDKRDDLGFPTVNFPWFSGDVPRLPSYGTYISHLGWFARCCTIVYYLHSKNIKLFTQDNRYDKLQKKFFKSYSALLSKFGYNIVSKICI